MAEDRKTQLLLALLTALRWADFMMHAREIEQDGDKVYVIFRDGRRFDIAITEVAGIASY